MGFYIVSYNSLTEFKEGVSTKNTPPWAPPWVRVSAGRRSHPGSISSIIELTPYVMLQHRRDDELHIAKFYGKGYQYTKNLGQDWHNQATAWLSDAQLCIVKWAHKNNFHVAEGQYWQADFRDLPGSHLEIDTCYDHEI